MPRGKGGNGLPQSSQSRPYNHIYITRKPRPCRREASLKPTRFSYGSQLAPRGIQIPFSGGETTDRRASAAPCSFTLQLAKQDISFESSIKACNETNLFGKGHKNN